MLVVLLLVSPLAVPRACEAVQESGPLVINELMIDPSAVTDAKGEWIELYNISSEPVNLRNWAMGDGKRDYFHIESDLIMGPGAYAVLARNGNAATNGGVPADYAYRGMSLANTADSVALYDPEGVLVDIITYDKSSFHIQKGCSLELIFPLLENGDGNNWKQSSSPYGDGDKGTPGMRNSAYDDPGDDPVLAYPPQLLVFGQQNEVLISYYCSEIHELSLAAAALDPPQLFEAMDALSGASILVQRMGALAHGLSAIRARSLVPELDAQLGCCRAILEHHVETEQSVTVPTALFCDNKGQYYHHGKAGLLKTLLAELGLAMKVQNTGDITVESLEGYELVIITNPQTPFSEGEVSAIGEYLANGGNLLVTGQYYEYIFADELNRLTAVHGIMFTDTLVIDGSSNTGKPYFPLITSLDRAFFPSPVEEVHYAYGCVLRIDGATPLLFAEATAEVVDQQGELVQVPGRPVLAAVSGDGSVLALSSSTLVTTSLFRGDNYGALKQMLLLLLGDA
jgi:hypothetical protein